ncbi:lysoplasmalogenase [Sabulilitoribacter arenilitoris]|uniref:Lysoplasmalogenase n=1 Tax=Wocania arenilitoris TaxID=2044858 RepID=A0AAE3ENA6_9FLAO|nr:lysoplasmalogenase family protein [Wocania arenilitoris]MCF7568565.1 lysoplasmalogenase [Wocania arenilitoris]
MVKHIFKNNKRFTLLFFSILFLDIYVKLNCSAFPYRFISKPFVILLLIGYFYFNKVGSNYKKHLCVLLALVCFLIGDLLNIYANYDNFILLGFSLFFFSVAKIFLSMKFSHRKDFNVSRLIPFTLIMFVYTIFLIWFLYEDLGVFLTPALITFFLTLLMVQFAYLRQGAYSNKSYIYVFLGVILYAIEEGLFAVQIFKLSLPFQDFLIMFLYGAAVYFIVFGVINEKEYEQKQVEKFDNKINAL